MKKLEAMNKMCLDVIGGKELTAKRLYSYGFTPNDLRELMQKGYLKNVKYGLYSFELKDVSNGVLSIMAGKDNSFNIFEEILKQRPDDVFVKYNLFISCVLSCNFDRAFDMFEQLYKINDERLRKNLNYYLFLLDEVTTIPEEFRYICKEAFEIGGIYVPHDGKDSSEINKVRNDVSIRRFGSAENQLEEGLKNKSLLTPEDILENYLLEKARIKKFERKRELAQMSLEKDNAGTDSLLADRVVNHTVDFSEEYILKIRNKISEIQSTKTIPKVIKEDSKDIFEAIDNNDFFAALKFSETKPGDLRLWIVHICSIIVAFSKQFYPTAKSPEKNLTKYLEIIKKQHYKMLINYFMKIGLHIGSMDDAIGILEALGNDNFIFKTEEYEAAFKNAVEKQQNIVARMYLNVLGIAKKYGEECKNIEELSEMMSFAEQIDEEKRIANSICAKLTENKGALILGLNKEKNITDIINEIRKHDNIGITVLPCENESEKTVKIILRYQTEQWSNGRLRKYDKEASDLYGTANFVSGNDECADNCIYNDLQILEHSSNPDPISYKRLGEAYYRNQNYELAFNYLRIYKAVTKVEDKTVNFLLNYLKSVFEDVKRKKEQSDKNYGTAAKIKSDTTFVRVF